MIYYLNRQDKEMEKKWSNLSIYIASVEKAYSRRKKIPICSTVNWKLFGTNAEKGPKKKKKIKFMKRLVIDKQQICIKVTYSKRWLIHVYSIYKEYIHWIYWKKLGNSWNKKVQMILFL